ncbi:hypothetical protein, partial [Roseovarius indicus]|uniref:hypothetical protein n=1 Tax=Roseovarius indicus TaxID=540747 RepID=UPI0032ECB1D9
RRINLDAQRSEKRILGTHCETHSSSADEKDFAPKPQSNNVGLSRRLPMNWVERQNAARLQSLETSRSWLESGVHTSLNLINTSLRLTANNNWPTNLPASQHSKSLEESFFEERVGCLLP